MSDFDELDRQAQAAQVVAFGDTVLIIPQNGSDYGTSVDGARPQKTVKAVFSQEVAAQRTQGTSQGSGLVGATRVASGLSELWISRDDLLTIGYAIREKDHVVFQGKTYAVVWCLPVTPSGDRTYRLSVVK